MKRSVVRLLRVRENQNIEFWVTHAFLFASTVVGVYLAASTGLDTAMEFDKVHTMRQGYNVQTALMEEVEDNTEMVEYWLKLYDEGNRSWVRAQDKEFETYIWEAMGEHSETFAIDGGILSGVRRYYRYMRRNADKLDTSGNFNWDYVKNIREKTAQVRTELLPAMREDLMVTAEELRKMGITVRPPRVGDTPNAAALAAPPK